MDVKWQQGVKLIMKIVKCNRCGKEIPPLLPSNLTRVETYPIVTMNIKYNWIGMPIEIDLCHDCSKAVANFVNQAEDGDHNAAC